jgi:hypothetical protein
MKLQDMIELEELRRDAVRLRSSARRLAAKWLEAERRFARSPSAALSSAARAAYDKWMQTLCASIEARFRLQKFRRKGKTK